MNNEFKTKDIGLASYLVVEGRKPVDIKLEGTFVFFYFSDQNLIRKMEQDYKYGGAKVEARKFNDALRNMKAEVFQLKSGEVKTGPKVYR